MISYKFSNTKLKQFLLYFGIALFPFQNLCLKMGGIYDLSAFFLWFYIVLLGFETTKKNLDKKLTVNLKYLVIFSVAQIIIFFFTETPFYRLVSGLVWFNGLLLIIVFREKIEVDFLKVYKIIIITLLITILKMITEIFSGYTPKGFFGEPSYAGLALFSASASYYGCYLFDKAPSKKKVNIFLLGILFFIAGLSTMSMHIVSFFIVVFFALYVSNKKINFFIIFLWLTFAYIIFYSSSHYIDRINSFKIIFNSYDYLYNKGVISLESSLNMSTLNWLDGLTQARSAIMINPLTGFGLGSVGFFHYESFFDTLLVKFYGSNPNRFDSYSGLFRLVIEFGLILPSMALFSIFKSLSFFKLKLQPTFELLFLRFFSLTMIIGILIKEPSYSRSIVYVAVLLFALCFIKPRKADL